MWDIVSLIKQMNVHKHATAGGDAWIISQVYGFDVGKVVENSWENNAEVIVKQAVSKINLFENDWDRILCASIKAKVHPQSNLLN